jgi:hypothetical protein
MVEVLGAATAIGMAAATARFGIYVGEVWSRNRDEWRFGHLERTDLDRRLDRIVGEGTGQDDRSS